VKRLLVVLALLSAPAWADVVYPGGGGGGGGSVDTSGNNAWTGTNSFLDNKWSLCEHGTPTNCLTLDLGGISASRELLVLNIAGTVPVSLSGAGAPGGSCISLSQYTDTLNSRKYECVNTIWVLVGPGATGAAWGSITGTLATQTDLADVLAGKPDVTVADGAPGGSCTVGSLYVNSSNGSLYSCPVDSWVLIGPGATGAVWGSITGTLSDQSDLQLDLDAKVDDPLSTGIVVETAATTYAARSLTSSGGTLVWTNPDGVAGDIDGDVDRTVVPIKGSGAGDHPASCGDVGDDYQVGDTYQKTGVNSCTCIDVDTWTCSDDASGVSLDQGELAGRGASSGTGAIEAITVGSGLTMSGTTLSATGGNADPWTYVWKSSTETISNDNTLSNDAALNFTMSSGGKYVIEYYILYSTDTAADFKFGIACPDTPANITSDWLVFRHGTNGVSSGTFIYAKNDNLCGGSISVATSSDSGTGYIKATTAMTNGSTAGTFAFTWAQDTSNAANTSVVYGSYLRYRTFP
jgi:hypothetical protein